MSHRPAAGAGARAGAPDPAPLPDAAPDAAPAMAPNTAPLASPYRQLRAQFDAALVTLYERTALTVRAIARLAGRTDRDIYLHVRRLGCRPHNAKTCRPGLDHGVRRAGPAAPPLDAQAAAAAHEAFGAVAQRLAALADLRLADDLHCATATAQRRTLRTVRRKLVRDARSLQHLACAFDDLAAVRARLEAPAKPPRKLKPARKPKRPSGPTPEEERVWRLQWMRQIDAHDAKRQAERAARAAKPAPPPVEVPVLDAETERRINEIAEQYYARAQDKGPRVRKLW